MAVFVTGMVDRFEKWREVQVRRRARRKGQVPALPLIEEDGTTRFVRFDDYIDGVMIDRKVSVNRAAKFRHQAMREHRVLTQNGRTARWEVPSERVRKRAEDVLRTLDIDTITVELRTLSPTSCFFSSSQRSRRWIIGQHRRRWNRWRSMLRP